MINIALYQPDIPQNTAAIIRTCACFDLRLEIIKPAGFILNERKLERVYLDYLEKCDKQFNFIFADPPYNYEKYLDIVQLIKEKNLVKKNGLLIIEHDKNNTFDDENLELRKYGTTYFSIFSF